MIDLQLISQAGTDYQIVFELLKGLVSLIALLTLFPTLAVILIFYLKKKRGESVNFWKFISWMIVFQVLGIIISFFVIPNL